MRHFSPSGFWCLPIYLSAIITAASIHANHALAEEVTTQRPLANIYYSKKISQSQQTKIAALSSGRFNFINIDTNEDRLLFQHQQKNNLCIATLDKPSALKLLTLRNSTPYVLLGLSNLLLHKLHKSYKTLGISVSGMSRDLPLRYLLAATKAVAPDTRQVAMFLSQRSRFWRKSYEKQAAQLGLQLQFVYLSVHETPAPFSQLFAKENHWLLMQDDELLRRDGLRAIVEVNLDVKRKIVGSRKEDIAQGALMSVVADENQLAKDSLRLIEKVCSHQFEGLIRPQGYRVLINEQLANNLGYDKPLIKATKQRIQDLLKSSKHKLTSDNG